MSVCWTLLFQMGLEEIDPSHSSFPETKHIYTILSLDSSWYFLCPCWGPSTVIAGYTCSLHVKGLCLSQGGRTPKLRGQAQAHAAHERQKHLNPDLAGQPTWLSKPSVSYLPDNHCQALCFCCWEFNFETGVTMSESTQEVPAIPLVSPELQSSWTFLWCRQRTQERTSRVSTR